MKYSNATNNNIIIARLRAVSTFLVLELDMVKRCDGERELIMGIKLILFSVIGVGTSVLVFVAEYCR